MDPTIPVAPVIEEIASVTPPAIPVVSTTALYDEAVINSRLLLKKPEDAELLHMYGMFKYVKEGNASGAAPMFIWDASGYYKWHDWKSYDDRNVEEVRTEYITYIASLATKYGMKIETVPDTSI